MRLVAIVPTYRNLATLPGVIAGLEASGLPVIVVDDGSQDGTAEWLRGWAGAQDGGPGPAQRVVEMFPANRGKGAALEAGLARARALGFEAALTVDADGQHLLDDALRLAAQRAPGTLVVGSRREKVDGYPPKSLFGRRLWALGVRSVTGLGVDDPICGLRVYPLAGTESIAVSAGRYAWEEEFLVRAAWAGIEIRQDEIATVYQPPGIRVTHFAGRDWTEGFTAWGRLALIRIAHAARCARPRGPLVRRDRSWRRLVGCAVAVACALGATAPLVASLPVAAWLAWRLHAPIVATVAVTAAAAGVAAWASAGWMTALASIPIGLALGFTAAKAARPLCSS